MPVQWGVNLLKVSAPWSDRGCPPRGAGNTKASRWGFASWENSLQKWIKLGQKLYSVGKRRRKISSRVCVSQTAPWISSQNIKQHTKHTPASSPLPVVTSGLVWSAEARGLRGFVLFPLPHLHLPHVCLQHVTFNKSLKPFSQALGELLLQAHTLSTHHFSLQTEWRSSSLLLG